MRNIKFRAWDGEKFRESFVVHQANGLAMIETITPLGHRYLEFQHNWVVQQYTGFKDRNGVEIYEGDIVEFCIPKHEPETETVTFEDAVFWAGYPLYEVASSCKVVGNVFEGVDK